MVPVSSVTVYAHSGFAAKAAFGGGKAKKCQINEVKSR